MILIRCEEQNTEDELAGYRVEQDYKRDTRRTRLRDAAGRGSQQSVVAGGGLLGGVADRAPNQVFVRLEQISRAPRSELGLGLGLGLGLAAARLALGWG